MVADVVAAIDFASTCSRALCSMSAIELDPELILISPQVIEVPQKSIENYEKYKISEAKAENSAWVALQGKYFAIGFLAKNNFYTSHSIKALKVDSAILQALAIVGSFAQRKKLTSFSFSLGIVLPWNELQDKEKFEANLAEALSSFIFRGQLLSINLESFMALPEGGGIFSRGRIPPKGEFMLKDMKEHNIVVIMLGYRNSSILIVEKGELKGVTGDFGLARMIEKIQAQTSGQTPEMLLPVVCQARGKLGKGVLGTLARSTRKELREIEIEEISEAINYARSEYVVLLATWLLQNLPHGMQIDELMISGGTSLYLKAELIQLFKTFAVQINWCETLEERLNQAFGKAISHSALESRLADVYGLFYKMTGRPLPILKKPIGEPKNVRAS